MEVALLCWRVTSIGWALLKKLSGIKPGNQNVAKLARHLNYWHAKRLCLFHINEPFKVFPCSFICLKIEKSKMVLAVE